MSVVQPKNCSICSIYEPCYHVCCMVVFLCRNCLMDSDLLAQNNQCPECYRSLEAVYHSLVSKARFGEGGNNRMRQNAFGNGGFANSQISQQKSLMMNHSSSMLESRQEVEEEFQFAETLHQRQSQVNNSKFRNNFTSNFRHNQTNQRLQESFNHQGMNNSFVESKPFPQTINQGNNLFSSKNNFKSNQFNQNRNNTFDNSGYCEGNFYQQNLGFQHQNELYTNNINYQQQKNGFNNNYENQNGVFNQNIRQNRPFNHQNHNFQQNRFQNNFGQNDSYQNQQQQMKFTNEQNKSNPFVMWNQQRPNNNMHQSQFNMKNQTIFNQTHNQDVDSFRFQDNSFQRSQQRLTKSVGKVNQLQRINNFTNKHGTSSSFKIDNHGNHSNSDKQHSPTFGNEWNNNEQSFGGVLVPFGGQVQGGREKMEIEQNDASRTLINRTKSHDSLVTLGKRDLSQE